MFLPFLAVNRQNFIAGAPVLPLGDEHRQHPQAGRTGRIRFFITDDPQRFTRTGSLFLNMTITDSDVRLVDLENVPLPDAAETPTQRKSS